MFRSLSDFHGAWEYESAATLKIFGALTEKSLAQSSAPPGRTLGRLAWHITLTLRELMEQAGLTVGGPGDDAPVPSLPEIVRQYQTGARAVADAVRRQWTDAMLPEKVPMYGEQWARGSVLFSLIVHQAHHRGQMTALMRLAGLKVPGIYGPAHEEWAAMNMPAQP